MIAHDALSGLINLADTLAVAKHLATEQFLVWLISYTTVSAVLQMGWYRDTDCSSSEHHLSIISLDSDAAFQFDIAYVVAASNR